MSKEKILITGGAGFIGSHLSEKIAEDCSLFVVDNLSSGKEENIKNFLNDISFFDEDINNQSFLKKLFNEHKFNTIYHLSATSSVQKCTQDIKETFHNNISATLSLLDYASSKDVKKFIFASSAAVFGDEDELPKKEDSSTNPISHYGLTKLVCEKYIKIYHEQKKIKTLILRFFNIFGHRQNPSSPYSGVLSIFINAFLKKRPFVTIYGDGKQTRDFVWIDDLVNILDSVRNKENIFGQIINIGTGKESNLLEVLNALENITSKKAIIHFKPKRQGDIFRSFSSTDTLSQYGLKATTPLELGLKKLINQLK